MKKINLYINTLRYMKPKQLFYRIGKKVGIHASLGIRPKFASSEKEDFSIADLTELTYDPVFLQRFSVEEIMEDRLTLLHSSVDFSWEGKWEFTEKSPLWNFNLHYMEYLFPLLKAYEDSDDSQYLKKVMKIFDAWMTGNPRKRGGPGWAAYTIDLRLTNWLLIYSRFHRDFRKMDDSFPARLLQSMKEQFDYLSRHLEKDILGNHYFEDLKTLLLAALFFEEEAVLKKAVKALKKEWKEEILSDGMHYERSPMYHKLILEGMFRVCYALREAGKADQELESYLPSMIHVAWSLEQGLARIPLFNDGGDNISKSLTALLQVGEKYFYIIPETQNILPDGGYYIYRQEYEGSLWTLLVDAGKPGPDYIPGHAHCDAMSFELYRDGDPIITNAGTYAYQCDERGYFRSTAAHNTIMVDGAEQSQCWGAFRMAKRAVIREVIPAGDGIRICIRDYQGHNMRRAIIMRKGKILITDDAWGKEVTGFLHCYQQEEAEKITKAKQAVSIKTDAASVRWSMQPYSPEYGKKWKIPVMEYRSKQRIHTAITLHGGKTLDE